MSILMVTLGCFEEDLPTLKQAWAGCMTCIMLCRCRAYPHAQMSMPSCAGKP